jgi:DNA-directed RNA polymerase specialized sigma24 family protein
MSVTSLPTIGVPGHLARLNAEAPRQRTNWEWGTNPDLWLYRDRTTALLQRYLRLAMEVGRLPSLLGREFFRSRVTSYHISTFEDSVIFVHDIEKCLEKLDPFSQKLIAKIVLQEYSQPEAAGILGCPLRTVERSFPEALDQLSDVFLRVGIIKHMCTPSIEQESCQEGETEENFASDCFESE